MTNKEKNILQKNIVDSLDTNPHGILLLAPRSGKTKIIIDIIKRDKPNSILWVTPSAKLANEDIPNEFDMWKAKRYKKKLTTITWMSLHKMTGKYDTIILDELQFSTENNMQNLLNGMLQYGNIIGMTGTHSEHFNKQDMYRRLHLKKLHTISINEAVDMKLLANYSINVVNVDMSKDKIIQAGNSKNRFMTSEIKQYEYLSAVIDKAIANGERNIKFKILARMRAIKNSPSKTKAAKWLISLLNGRKLIFSATIKQAEELCEYNYHSKTDNKHLQQFIKGDIDCISMVNAGGTGFTYKKIDHLILIQADSNKNGLTSQKISRTLLDQKDYKATIWILCLNNTQDTKWVASTLKSFDESKIRYINFKDLII